jgi:catechol 2,3-dioxygenase-like lactoylglutathione lyase family enzyme
MSVGLLDHFNIRTRKLAETVRFYEEVLDLKKGDRPNFAFPGAWMYSEGKPVVHVVDISQTSNRNPTPAWSITSPSQAAASPA